MTPLLLFVHGWGFDARLWDGVRACFPPDDTLAWDLGFFGAPARPAPPPGRPVIAVGHSFGALWLAHGHPGVPLVALNGFTCFARRPDFATGVAPRVLARMRARLRVAPEAVVAEFRAACGCTVPAPISPDADALDAGLAALEDWDERGTRPLLALCGASDALISPAMSETCFPNIVWHPGGHLLPLEAPDWCAAQLAPLLA